MPSTNSRSELNTGFHTVPTGCIAAVVTHLEMTRRPTDRAPDHSATLAPFSGGAEDYRAIFRAVGTPWMWFSRLALPETELAAILDRQDVRIFIPQLAGRPLGLLELDLAQPAAPEIVFFGLIPEATGQGLGRWMMGAALDMLWQRPGTQKVTLHTCTLDSPAALPFYLKQGFQAVRREVEVMPDPRLTGLLAETAAPHVPIARETRA